MPIIQSAKKALRQSVRRRARNIKKKELYKKAVKDFRKLAHAGILDKAKNMIPQVYKTLDKAVKTNVIKKNKASRLKSRLTKMLTSSK